MVQLSHPWASLIAPLVNNLPAMQEILLDSWSGRSAVEGIGYPLQYSWASLVAQLVKNLLTMQETLVQLLGQEGTCWRRDKLPTPVFLGFPCDSAGKETTCNAGDLSSIPGLERSPGEGKGYPFQYSGPENSMDLNSGEEIIILFENRKCYINV